MPAKLVVISGPDKGLNFGLIPGQTFQIGRSSSTNTRLTDPSISRVHCEIEYDSGGELTLHNISTNGTQVNGASVTERTLASGDVIGLGDTELKILVEEAATGEPSAFPDLERLIGQTLDDYLIESVIARGNQGVIFKVQDLNNNRRPLALKVFPPEFGQNDEDVNRFVRAMHTMMPVRHPHLVSIHGAGKSGPYCYIAMEFIDGDSLLTLIQRNGSSGVLHWKEAYRVGVHIARALEYAQELSIVHRNVTPANILYRTFDRVAKLGDLMLAKATEGRLAQPITRPGRILGDLSYMPPERTQGMDALDTRADLYGLGATLYALLTGQPPFVAHSTPDLIAMIRNATPDSPKVIQSDIPDEFERIVMKLLAKKPEDRYQTAKSLSADLEKFGNAVGVSAYF